MPIDYSKWDKIELSDDSDIEVHPNVDKRSFIRWKQQDIHQKRTQRNHDIQQIEIQTPMYEELNRRADKLLKDINDSELGDFNYVKEYLTKSFSDSKPENPTLDSEAADEQPTFNEMIEDLFIQLKSQIEKSGGNPNDGAILRKEIINHHKKIDDVLKQNKEKLVQLYEERELHISSEDMHTGWDRSFLNKDKSAETATQPTTVTTSSNSFSNPQSTSTVASDFTAVNKEPKISSRIESVDHQLQAAQSELPGQTQVGAEANAKTEEEEFSIDDIHPDTWKLSQIPITQTNRIKDFLSSHPSIINSKQKDSLLMKAFDSQFAHDSNRTKQIIYHSSLIQYVIDVIDFQKATHAQQIKIIVEQLFSKIFNKNPNNPALAALHTEVENTFQHIKTRCEVLSKEQQEDFGEDDENAEIQLKSLDDNTELIVNIPDASSDVPEEKLRYEVFTTQLPHELQVAMKTGSLDEVNKVFKTIAFKKAEEILEIFQEYGFIGIQEGIIENEKDWTEIKNAYEDEGHPELNKKVEELNVVDDVERFTNTADIVD
ncbi:hypothetical protein WICMUC_005751 [Wickerhamomyces mucosus]|uniref:Hsp90 chaperone protein kinase-targeting subunit n=1 Tax=Wickerhamomyces mucosus TaxID=1378264 RepID=A0A9P8T360_9ASCO|nr:hypothetical protein WICMUC_005751 [Wickerhamomyces mucosus]